MPEMPVLSGKAVVAALEKAGFGLKGILRDIKITTEEFVALL